MGSLYKNVCYSSQSSARTASCSAFDLVTSDGVNVYTAQCVSTDMASLSMDVCKRQNGGVCAVQSQPWPLMPDCDFDAGTSLASDWFYAAFTLVAITWGGKKLIQLFDRNTLES